MDGFGADSADRTRPDNVPRPQSKWRFMGESYPAAFHGQPEISAKNEIVSAGLGFRAAGEPLPNNKKKRLTIKSAGTSH